jgi:hypothetical protein
MLHQKHRGEHFEHNQGKEQLEEHRLRAEFLIWRAILVAAEQQSPLQSFWRAFEACRLSN